MEREGENINIIWAR